MRSAWLAALAVVAVASPAVADRAPVAVLWVGPPSADAAGFRALDAIHGELAKSATARPIDTASHLLQVVRQMPSSELNAHLQLGKEAFGAMKVGDAVREYESAERIAFDSLPVVALPRVFADIERGLLGCYDQLGQKAAAYRAASRLAWVAAPDEPARALLEKYWHPREYFVSLPPVAVTSDPPGAEVFRDLRLVGTSPAVVEGGEPEVDRLSIELPGYRPLRRELGWNERELKVILVPEDRIAVRLDQIRQGGLEASPAAVAAIAKDIGAERVLLVTVEGDIPKGRWIDVAKLTQSPVVAFGVDNPAKIVAAVAPPPAAPAVAKVEPKPAAKSKWGKWYTWVAAGGVVLLVGGLLIAKNVGSDKFTLTVKKD